MPTPSVSLSPCSCVSRRLVLDPRDALAPYELAALLIILSAKRSGGWIACEGFLPGATLMLTSDWCDAQGLEQLHTLAEAVVAPLAGWVEAAGRELRSRRIGYTTVIWCNAATGLTVVPDFTVVRLWPWQLYDAFPQGMCPEVQRSAARPESGTADA